MILTRRLVKPVGDCAAAAGLCMLPQPHTANAAATTAGRFAGGGAHRTLSLSESAESACAVHTIWIMEQGLANGSNYATPLGVSKGTESEL